MAFSIFCLFLVSFIILSEEFTLDEQKSLHLKWSKFAYSIPEVHMIHNAFNVPFPYNFDEAAASLDFNNGNSSGDLDGNFLDNMLVQWENETLDLIDIYMNISTEWLKPSSKCGEDLLYMLFRLNTMWARQMIDASGKPAAGIMRGGTTWLGNAEECQEVTVPPEEVGRFTFGDFSGQQCLVQWNVSFSSQMEYQFRISICLPSSCNNEQLKSHSDAFVALVRGISSIGAANKTNTTFDIGNVDCSDHARSWTKADIVYMFLLSVFCLLIFAGTLCDIWNAFQSKNVNIEKENKKSDRNDCDVSINTEEDVILAQNTVIAVGKEELEDKEDPPLLSDAGNSSNFDKPKIDLVKELLICFSVYSNGAKLLNVENQQGQLGCLHGIRFLSMSWVIFGHVFAFSIAYLGNTLDEVNLLLNSFSFQAVYQGTYSVDTFFFLSGFLLAYLFLKEYSNSDKKINWIYYYIHRIWRLSPAFFMILGFYTTLWLHLGSGPLWPTKTDNGNCDKYWWWDILYIVNFQEAANICMAWVWYLANDMQFYIISPLFLIFLLKLPIVGNMLICIVMLASWIATCLISVNNNFDAIIDTDGNDNIMQFMLHEINAQTFFQKIYIRPYCRIGPYLIGILVGFALHKTNGRKKFMKMWMAILGWLIAMFLIAIIILGPYHSNMGNATAAAYNGLSRTAWGIGVGWVSFACLTGYGGPINTLLSWKLWVPLSRLTYCAYLVHPMVMGWYFGRLQSILHFQMDSMVIYYFGFLLASYLVAFVASLTFESPMMALEKFFLKHFSKS